MPDQYGTETTDEKVARLAMEANDLEDQRDEARAQVAALREVLEDTVGGRECAYCGGNHICNDTCAGRAVLSDTEAAAQAHDAAIRKAALEEAAHFIRRNISAEGFDERSQGYTAAVRDCADAIRKLIKEEVT